MLSFYPPFGGTTEYRPLCPYTRKQATPEGMACFLVPVVGLEPTRCCHQRILSNTDFSEVGGL